MRRSTSINGAIKHRVQGGYIYQLNMHERYLTCSNYKDGVISYIRFSTEGGRIISYSIIDIFVINRIL